jgi:hypothetical protein
MKTLSKTKAVLALVLAVVLASALSASAAVTPAVKNATLEPAAIGALEKMGSYLRSLSAYEIAASVQKELVLENGLKVQMEESANLVARRPDRLTLQVSSERKERKFFYNGRQFTLWAPRMNSYATVVAPPTIWELITKLEEKFGIEMPLVDLLKWGTEESRIKDITIAMELGKAKVGGADCTHYGFRQEGLDWQIWIQNGNYPLPRKLVLTTTTDEARPQYQAVFTWNLAPAFNDTDFTFNPPPGAQRIVFAQPAQ